VAVRLVFFGRQGAGKGTQAKKLCEHFGAPHVSTGDMLRDAVAEGTDFGRKAKEYIESGHLVPDDIMLGVIDDRLHKPDVVERGFLLDGFPRTVAQAEALLGFANIDLAVNLDVPEQMVLERISDRRVCKECGHIYTATDPSAIDGLCEICGGAVVQRDDDTPAAIRTRLDAYATKTMKAVRWFDDQGLLVTVDGVGTPEEVFQRLVSAIGARANA
jgi:adenylate kinase